MKEIPNKDINANPATYITAPGTLTVNTNTNVVSLHDGITQGGVPLVNAISVAPANISSLSPTPPAGVALSDPTTGLVYGQGDGQGGYVTNSPVSLPFYRRMEATSRGLTRFTAQGLLTRVSGDGSIVKQIDQPFVWNGKDWVTENCKLELFRFSGGIPVAPGCGIPYNARVASIQPTIGVTLDRPALQFIGPGTPNNPNGLKMLFGNELPALSYPNSVLNGTTVVTITGATVAMTNQLRPNMRVIGTYIPAGTLIASVQSGVGYTMTNAATSSITETTYIMGMELTAGSAVGSPVLTSPGTATLGANTSNISVGMTVIGAPISGAYQNAFDHLVISVPAGVITPTSRIRLEYSFAEVFSSGVNPGGYTNGVMNAAWSVRPAGKSNQQSAGLVAALHQLSVTVAATAKLFTKHYMEIQFLNNVAMFNYDGETGSAGARLFGQSGAPTYDFGGPMEIAFRPFTVGNDPFHAQAQLVEASLTVYY